MLQFTNEKKYLVIYVEKLILMEKLFNQKNEAQKFANLKHGTLVTLPKKSLKKITHGKINFANINYLFTDLRSIINYYFQFIY